MSERGDKKVLKDVVALVQDNIFLRRVNKLMAKFIQESGVFNHASTVSSELYAILKYFKTEALNQLLDEGYDMGVQTPWGYDVTHFYLHRELMKNSNNDDLQDEEDDEYDEDDEDKL